MSTVLGVGYGFSRAIMIDCATGLCYTLAFRRLVRTWPRGLWRLSDDDERWLKSHVQISFCSSEHFGYGSVALFLTKKTQKLKSKSSVTDGI